MNTEKKKKVVVDASVVEWGGIIWGGDEERRWLWWFQMAWQKIVWYGKRKMEHVKIECNGEKKSEAGDAF